MPSVAESSQRGRPALEGPRAGTVDRAAVGAEVALLALHRIGAPEALAAANSAWPGAEAAAHEYLDKRHQHDELTCLGYAMTAS